MRLGGCCAALCIAVHQMGMEVPKPSGSAVRHTPDCTAASQARSNPAPCPPSPPDLSMLRGIGEDNGAPGDEEEGVIEEGLEDDDPIWETDDAKIQAAQAPKQVGAWLSVCGGDSAGVVDAAGGQQLEASVHSGPAGC